MELLWCGVRANRSMLAHTRSTTPLVLHPEKGDARSGLG